MKTRYAAYTITGNTQTGNRDNFFLNGETKPVWDGEYCLCGESEQPEQIFSVCDGMGDEVVAAMAVEALKPYTASQLRESWKPYIDDVSRQIEEYQSSHELKTGAVFAGLYLSDHQVQAINVGDSRIYCIRHGEIAQLSLDHIQVPSGPDTDCGQREEHEDADAHSRLTQYLGIQGDITLEPHLVGTDTVSQGDVYLLCSDGLSSAVSEEQLLRVISGAVDLSECCKQLVNLALEQGSQENLTAVLVQISAEEESAAPESAPAAGEEEAPAPEKRKKRLLLPILVIVLAAILAAGGAGFYLWSHPIVPDVVGMPQSDAEAVLSEQGFQVTAEECYNDDIEAGEVFAQSAQAGVRSGRSGDIIISVSLGVEPVPVDDVVGLNVEEAQTVLTDRGLVVEITESYSEEVPEGEVFAQSLQAGEKAFPGDTIQLNVSKGPEKNAVPDVTGKDRETARKVLEKAGYQVSDKWAYEDAAEGSVVYQNPEAGTKLDKGERVTLILSKGESRIDVPDLTGMSRVEAADTLVSLGLTYTFDYQSSSTVPSDHVISQTPTAGKSLLKGENVFFYLAR